MTAIYQETHIKGTPICRGIAIGRFFLYSNPADAIIPEISIEASCVDAEVDRYRCAVKGALEDIKRLQLRMQKENIADGAAILDGHAQMIQDALLTTRVEEAIRTQSKNAEYVFHSVIVECEERFNCMEDAFFRERFNDIKEISKRVLAHLRNNVRQCLDALPEDSIVFANDLTAFDTAEASNQYAAAFVTREGGPTSHAAIVAKAKGVPFVSSVDLESHAFEPGSRVIVDGRTGDVIVNPTEETLAKYVRLRCQLLEHLQKLSQTERLSAETYDGYAILLSANVECVEEIQAVHRAGSSGVGLLRTESVFLGKDDFPNEEEQYASYSQFVQKMHGQPIAIRTFDVGGDKFFRNSTAMYGVQLESNPFLGCRAIRFLLKETDLFKTQMKAILRAAVHGNVKMMFPMVSSLSELKAAKALLEEAKEELRNQEIPFFDKIPVGCMIEVPSSAIMADILVKECDFLSIGTNDLVQYTLAVDRTNRALCEMYTPAHPSVIRLIRLIVHEANRHGIPVSVCGEVAADPRFTPLLLGLGIHELSVAARLIPVVKNAVRSTSIIYASKLAEQVLALSSAEEIEALLTAEYRRNVPEDCFYNC